jgi:acetylornithine deacetylase/succinyl-diaminopimelate desuccinylase-like protein
LTASGANVQEGEDYIYGRGCIDDKHSVIGILIALGMSIQKKETLKTLHCEALHFLNFFSDK